MKFKEVLRNFKIAVIKLERRLKDYFSAEGADIYTRLVRRIFLAFLVAVFVAGCSIVIVLLIARIAHPMTKVPDVKEMDVVNAIVELQKRGLNIHIEPTFNTNYEKFTVIGQFPSKGLTVRKGRTVSLIVSLGKDLYTVPDLKGLSRKEAEELLLKNNIPYTITVIKDNNYPLDKVISQDPQPGIEVERSVRVKLLVNSELESGKYRVENFINQSVENAVRSLLQGGITPVLVKQVASSIEEDGIVLGQEIPSGEVISSSSEVKLYVGVYGDSEEEIRKANYHYFSYVLSGLQPGESKEFKVLISDEKYNSKEILSGTMSVNNNFLFTVFKSYGSTKLYLIVDNSIVKEVSYE